MSTISLRYVNYWYRPAPNALQRDEQRQLTPKMLNTIFFSVTIYTPSVKI